MKKSVLLLLLVSLITCQKSDDAINLANLNGYWEIQKVTEPNKDPKVFTVNETFEHFMILGDSGVRSKVKPQFDGTFLSNDQHEKFVISSDNGKTFLNYKTPFATWKEQILTLKDSVLIVQNQEKKEFQYKKTGSLNFTGNGQKTQ